MLTELDPYFPESTGDAKRDYEQLVLATKDWFRRLNAPDSLAFPDRKTWTPTVTAGSGTITTATATGVRDTLPNGLTMLTVEIAITTNGTGSGDVRFTLEEAPTENVSLYGRETTTAGWGVVGVITANTTTGILYKYDASYPGADGYNLVVSGFYR
jgi:hypothetical protein